MFPGFGTHPLLVGEEGGSSEKAMGVWFSLGFRGLGV